MSNSIEIIGIKDISGDCALHPGMVFTRLCFEAGVGGMHEEVLGSAGKVVTVARCVAGCVAIPVDVAVPLFAEESLDAHSICAVGETGKGGVVHVTVRIVTCVAPGVVVDTGSLVGTAVGLENPVLTATLVVAVEVLPGNHPSGIAFVGAGMVDDILFALLGCDELPNVVAVVLGRGEEIVATDTEVAGICCFIAIVAGSSNDFVCVGDTVDGDRLESPGGDTLACIHIEADSVEGVVAVEAGVDLVSAIDFLNGEVEADASELGAGGPGIVSIFVELKPAASVYLIEVKLGCAFSVGRCSGIGGGQCEHWHCAQHPHAEHKVELFHKNDLGGYVGYVGYVGLGDRGCDLRRS